MNELHAAYLAGVVDGEGSVMLTQKKPGWFRRPELSVASSDFELLEWIQLTTGVGRIVPKRKQREPHYRQAWQWVVRDNKAIVLLALIAPHLRITKKRRKAELIVERYSSVTRRNGFYTPDQRAAKTLFESEFAAT